MAEAVKNVVHNRAVFSAGTVNADFLLVVPEPLEPGASVVARRLLRTSGGRAANVAVMARRLAVPARLYGCIGVDELAEQALAGPRSAGVDLAAVRRVAAHTGLVTSVVGPGGTKTMVLAAGANDAFADEDGRRLAADLQVAPPGSVLVVDNEVSAAAVSQALEAARGNLPTVLDPTRPRLVTDRLIELSDHLTPNADEAAALTGISVESRSDAHRAAWSLRERGARHVHVRMRGGGCLTVWPDGEAFLAAPGDVQVVDTTGAGDAFAGALASAIAMGLPPLEAARRGVAAATHAVGALGAQDSYPNRAELDALAQRVRVVS